MITCKEHEFDINKFNEILKTNIHIECYFSLSENSCQFYFNDSTMHCFLNQKTNMLGYQTLCILIDGNDYKIYFASKNEICINFKNIRHFIKTFSLEDKLNELYKTIEMKIKDYDKNIDKLKQQIIFIEEEKKLFLDYIDEQKIHMEFY